MSLGLGVIGCGSVFAGPYRGMIASLARGRPRAHERRLRHRRRKRRGAAAHYGVDPELAGPDDVVAADDVDVVLVLTSMNEHGPLDASGARGGQARPGREADGDLARGGGRDRRAVADGGRAARLRAAHPAQPDVPRRPRRRA